MTKSAAKASKRTNDISLSLFLKFQVVSTLGDEASSTVP